MIKMLCTSRQYFYSSFLKVVFDCEIFLQNINCHKQFYLLIRENLNLFRCDF